MTLLFFALLFSFSGLFLTTPPRYDFNGEITEVSMSGSQGNFNTRIAPK